MILWAELTHLRRVFSKAKNVTAAAGILSGTLEAEGESNLGNKPSNDSNANFSIRVDKALNGTYEMV